VKRRNRTDAAAWSRQGFTLLEMLVVIVLLAAVAFIGTGTFKGVSEHANDRLVRAEMQNIAKAIRRFKADTGYYPKTGPFSLVGSGGAVTYASLPSHAGSNNVERDLWFYSPANFYQLLAETSPLPVGDPLETWNPETGRGWRGPYIKGFLDGYVDIRDGINDGTPHGNEAGSPVGTLDNNVGDVDGIADPFEHRAVSVGGNGLLDWSAVAGGKERDFWGRPYLCFFYDTRPKLISMGANGTYNDPPGKEDNVELNIE